MSKKQLPWEDEEIGESLVQPDIQTVSPQDSSRKLWETKLWMGVKPVYHCTQCDSSRNDLDDLMEHILLHYSPEEQEQVLADMLKQSELERSNNG